MTRASATALAALVGVASAVAPSPASADDRATRGLAATTSYDHVVADFGGRSREGLDIAVIFDAFRFTENGQPMATAGAHADIGVDGRGYVCEADGPAALEVAQDLSTASLTTSLTGGCSEVSSGEGYGFLLEVEVTLTASGPVERTFQVIRPDSGGVCLQMRSERPAAGAGTATVSIEGLGVEESVPIVAAPSHRIEHVDEWCVPAGRA